MRSPRLLALLALAATLPALADEAGESTAYSLLSGNVSPIIDSAVRVSVRNGAVSPNYGYVPIRVSLENDTRERQTVELRFVPNESNRPVTRTVELAPGERREAILPAVAPERAGLFRAQVSPLGESGGQRIYFESTNRVLLFAGTPQQLEEAVGVRASTSPASIGVSTWEPENLPDELGALLGFDAVAVSPSLAELREGHRRALEAYAATGGTLILLDPRGLSPEHLPLLDASSARGGERAYGFGTVWLCRQSGGCRDSLLVSALTRKPRLTPVTIENVRRRAGSVYGEAPSGRFLLPQAMAPVGRFLWIIAAFTLAVGPGSVYLARRRGPTSLLVTIPGTALVTCLLIAGSSILFDGFTTHARSLSMTLLDGRQHRAVTLGVVAFYANLSPGSARFDRTAAVQMPAGATPPSIDWTQGTTFASDLVPSRTYREWAVSAIEPTRARLSVKKLPGGIRVQNALGERIAAARLTVGGKAWRISNVADGAEASATPDDAGNSLLVSELNDPLSRFAAEAQELLQRTPGEGRFVAHLDGPGPMPLGGITATHHGSAAFVVGEVE